MAIVLMIGLYFFVQAACGQDHRSERSVQLIESSSQWTVMEYEGDSHWKGVWYPEQQRGSGMCYWRDGSVYLYF